MLCANEITFEGDCDTTASCNVLYYNYTESATDDETTTSVPMSTSGSDTDSDSDSGDVNDGTLSIVLPIMVGLNFLLRR